MPNRRIGAARAALLALLLCLGAAPGQARAHVDARVNVRVVHFDYGEDGMTAYYRLSLALLAGAARPPQSYIVTRKESGHVFHYADQARLRDDALGAAALAAAGHVVTLRGRAVAPRLLSAAAHPRGYVPPFATVAQARAAAAAPSFPERLADIDIGDVLLDVAVLYPGVRSADSFEFASSLDVGAFSEAPVRNILATHAGGKVTQYASSGLLASPVTVNPPPLQAVREFVGAGAAHILEGFDHLLFVVCLVLADVRLRPIALKISAFSVGHSLSLAAGFYGWLPAAAWFAPTVELLIAVSVLGSALLMLGWRGGARHGAALGGAVGLVHGCGLAFGLREMLSESGPNLVASLLSFNLGVEAGQLLVGAALWLGFRLALALGDNVARRLRALVALASVAVALAWVAERLVPLWELSRAVP